MEQQARTMFVIHRFNSTYKLRMRSLRSDQLLQDILPEEEEIQQIGRYIGANWPDRYAYEKMADFKEAITVFLVGCAYYHYNDRHGGFWKSVGDMMGQVVSPPRAETLYRLFNSTIRFYGLLRFEEDAEESYRYVTPIQCHSGIPTNCLNSLIEKLAQTIEDRSFGRGNLTDSFLYLCRYGVNRPVLRFIEYLRHKGQSDEWLDSCRDILANVARSVLPSDGEQQEELPMRSYCAAAKEWLAQNKQASNVIRRGIRYEAPTLRLDEESATIFVDLPQQHLQNGGGSLLWNVTMAGQTLRIHRAAQQRRQEYWYAPHSLPVKDIREIHVSMTVPLQDGELQREWTLVSENETCLVFSRSGRQRLSDWLPEGVFIVVPHHPYRLHGEFREQIFDLSGGSTAYRVDTHGMDCIELAGAGCKPVRLRIRQEPVLSGKTLHGLVSEAVGNLMYDGWPDITLPTIHSGQGWKIEARNVNTGEQAISAEVPGSQTVSLAALLREAGGYGRYRITCYHNECGVSRFTFSCLPHLEMSNQSLWYWPFAGGYEPVSLSFHCGEAGMEVLDEAGSPIGFSIPIDVNEAWFSGSIRWREQLYPFVLAVRPYTFCFMDDQGEIYGQPNRTSRFTLRDINTIHGLSLNLVDSGALVEPLRTRLVLVSEGEEVQSYSISLSGTRSIPMEMFYDRIGTLQGELAELKLCIADKPEVTLVVIRLDAAVNNLHERNSNNGWLLQWEEAGPRRNRALYLIPLGCPWFSTRFPINDGDRFTMLEKHLVPWRGWFLVWVSSLPSTRLFEGQDELLPQPDSQALILYNDSVGIYQPMDPFTNCFYENMAHWKGITTWKQAYEALPIACFGENHIVKLLSAYLLLERRRDILQSIIDVPDMQKAYIYSICRLVNLFGCQAVLNALHTADCTSAELAAIESSLELDFPIKKNGKPISAKAWESLRRRNPPLALLYAYCDGVNDRIFSFLGLIQGQDIDFVLHDTEHWQSVNVEVLFLGRDDPAFLCDSSQIAKMAVQQIRSANKDDMLKLTCSLLKAHINGAQLQCKPLLRRWIDTLTRDHLHKYTSVLFNTLAR